MAEKPLMVSLSNHPSFDKLRMSGLNACLFGRASSPRVPGWAIHTAAAFAAAALCAIGSVASARAQDETFAVSGQVVNGTAGAELVGSLRVQVVALSRERVEATWDGLVDADGRYQVEGVGRLPGRVYMVGVDYGGARYAESIESPAVSTESGGPAGVQKDLTVYESTPTNPGLRFDQSALVVSAVDPARRALTLLEIHTVANPTDRTFAPRADGPGGPAGLLVFGLPPHAFDLNPEWGLDPARIVQIDRGFASLVPVVPGQTQVVFRYQVPYTEGVLRLQRTVRYPMASFQALAPLDGPRLESEDLATASTADIVGRQYRTLAGGPFVAGQGIRVAVAGLPVPGGPLAAVPPTSVAALGSSLGLILLVGAWWRTRLRPGDDEDAIESIVALDLDHEAGRIPDDDYREMRARLIAQALSGRRSAMSRPAERAASEG